MLYSAIAVANWFIEKNKTDACDLTHLKIQKLLYYAQGWFLGNFEVPLFDDPIEAWKHGPVIRSIYLALRDFKKNQIVNLILGPTLVDNKIVSGYPAIDPEDNKSIDFLNNYWGIYSKISPWVLVNDTHQPGTPWQQIYSEFGFENIIPKELMLTYFKALVEKLP
jgi:uncharacterized phage-associated protein